MKLYLMRHGATDEGPQMSQSRTLNDTGEMQAHAIRKFLKRADVWPDIIISSDFARAEDTAKILQRGDTPIVTTPALRPDPAEDNKYLDKAWKAILKLAGDSKTVLVVTHGPLIQRLAASVAFNLLDENWQWEHGGICYVNTHESRFRWFVTPKLAAHITEAEEPKEVEDPPVEPVTAEERAAFAREAVALAESLKRAHKAAALDPLKKTLMVAVSQRFRKQKVSVLRALGKHAKNWANVNYGEVRQAMQHSIKLNDPKFTRAFSATTLAAHSTGARHVAEQLGLTLAEATVKKPAPPKRTADDLTRELDDTTDKQMGTKLESAFDPVNPLGIGAVLQMVRGQFDQYAAGMQGQKSRAATVAGNEISTAYHGGGAAVASGTGAGKIWDIGDEGCPVCEANADDGWIGADDSFNSGDDAPPAHPNCDCSVSYRSDADTA